MRLLLAPLFLAVLATSVHAANLDFSIGNITKDATGGSFDVILTPSSEVIDLGNFGVNFELTNFTGGLGPIVLSTPTSTLLPLEANLSNPTFSNYPFSANSGDAFFVLGQAAGTTPDIAPSGASLISVDFSMPFPPGTSFDVTIIPGDPIFSPTDITSGNDPHDITSLGSATISMPIPEPASAALLVIGVAALGLVGRKRR